MVDYLRKTLKSIGRVLYTVFIQIIVIYLFIQFSDLKPMGYLLLLLPLTAIMATIINGCIVSYIYQRWNENTSRSSKILTTAVILVLSAVIPLLFTLMPWDLPFIMGFSYFYLGFPALIIEVLFRGFFRNKSSETY
ncbi:hypothetical protein ACF3NG_05425 [Aerococcaceae bacterium WGS1372]